MQSPADLKKEKHTRVIFYPKIKKGKNTENARKSFIIFWIIKIFFFFFLGVMKLLSCKLSPLSQTFHSCNAQSSKIFSQLLFIYFIYLLT